MFHRREDPANRTMRRLVTRLRRAKVAHAIMSGMAVYAHGHRRMTDDVDVLLTSAGLEKFKKLHVPKHFEPVPGRPRRFIDRNNGIILDCLVTGLFPGSGRPGPFAFPNPKDVRQLLERVEYVNLETLIQLKLAARRYQDFADVVNLIRVNDLDESYLASLHPSVRQDFIECLAEKRREDAYEALP
jgi:hypothetical protein